MRGLSLLVICVAFFGWTGVLCDARGEDLEKPSALSEEEVVTAASRYEESLKEAPAAVTIISQEDIRRYGYTTLADALRSVPGFFVAYDRQYQYVGVRGFLRPGDYSTRILLMVNGHPLNEDWRQANYIGTDFGLSLDLVERIEVVRGPGSALYGTNAVLAVVNVITKRGGELGGEGSLSLGSYGRVEGTALLGGTTSSGVSYLVSGAVLDVEGPDLFYPEYVEEGFTGWVRGGDYDRRYSTFMEIDYGRWSFRLNHNSRKKGVPTGAFETIFGDTRTHSTDGRSFAELAYDYPLARTMSLRTRLYYDQFRYFGNYPFEEGQEPTLWKEEGKGRWFGSEVRLDWKVTDSHRIVAGAEAQRHEVSTPMWTTSNDEKTVLYRYESPEHQFRSWALYLQEQWRLSEYVELTAGVHHDEYPNFQTGGTTNPRAALVLRPTNKTTLKLLYGEAFKAPSIYELYYSDDEETAVANPGLGCEKTRTSEVVLEQEWLDGNLRGQAAAYRMEIRSLITQVEVEDGLLQFQNEGDVNVLGGEIGITGRVAPGHRFFANLAYVDPEYVDSGERLTHVPRLLANVGISASLWKQSLFATLEENYVDSRLSRVEDQEIDGYFLTTFTLMAPGLIPRVEVAGSIYNLFDESYADPTGEEHLQLAIPQDGRRFRLKASYLF